MGVGVWPRCNGSYYWTVDFGDTIMGPQAITTNPIYDGAHMFNGTSQGAPVFTFMVGDLTTTHLLFGGK